MEGWRQHTLGSKMAQKPYIVWSLGPKALIYESFDPQRQGWQENSLSSQSLSRNLRVYGLGPSTSQG